MNVQRLFSAAGGMVLFASLLCAPAICAQTEFEQPPQLKPQDVLRDVPVKTGWYAIDPAVTNNGVMNEFYIHTGQTIWRVVGNERVPERLREIQAIGSLDRVRKSDAYVSGVKAAGKSTVNSIKTLVTNPVGTVSAIPGGVERFFGNAYRAAKRDDKSKYEDSTAKEAIGFSKVKRTLAASLGVDPYSSNDKLQEALNDVAWAAYAGGMSLKAASAFAIPSPVDTVLTSTQAAVQVSRLVAAESPENLRKINSDKLKAIGANERQIDGLLGNAWFSPTRQTILAECLSQMRSVNGIAAYLDWAGDAASEEQAFAIQRSAELLQGYNANQRPLAQLYLAGALPVAETKDGNAVLALAFDYLAWTEKAYDTARAIRADLPARLADKPIALVTSGQVSRRAAQGLKSLNFTVEADAAKVSAPKKK